MSICSKCGSANQDANGICLSCGLAPLSVIPVQKNNKATASLILGIAGILFGVFIPELGFVSSFVGIVLGILSRKKAYQKTAIAGIALSLSGTAVSVINGIAQVILLSSEFI